MTLGIECCSILLGRREGAGRWCFKGWRLGLKTLGHPSGTVNLLAGDGQTVFPQQQHKALDGCWRITVQHGHSSVHTVLAVQCGGAQGGQYQGVAFLGDALHLPFGQQGHIAGGLLPGNGFLHVARGIRRLGVKPRQRPVSQLRGGDCRQTAVHRQAKGQVVAPLKPHLHVDKGGQALHPCQVKGCFLLVTEAQRFFLVVVAVQFQLEQTVRPRGTPLHAAKYCCGSTKHRAPAQCASQADVINGSFVVTA